MEVPRGETQTKIFGPQNHKCSFYLIKQLLFSQRLEINLGPSRPGPGKPGVPQKLPCAGAIAADLRPAPKSHPQ